MVSYLLNPGDREAVEQGCTCAVLDNRYGQGFTVDGTVCYWITEGCPLHDPDDELSTTDAPRQEKDASQP